MSKFSEIVREVTSYNSNDWRWKLAEELYEKNLDPLQPRVYTSIPKKIHQIWIGPYPFPEKYKRWAETWKELNPDYEYKLWTDNDVENLPLPKIYYELNNYGPKSDILRYYILNEYGGVYVDTDFECIKSIDSLSYLSFYAGLGYPEKVEIYVGLIGCIPNHPIISTAYERVKHVNPREIKRSVLDSTSSYFFTKVFFDVVKSYQKGIVLFPTRYFYPLPNYKEIISENIDRKKYIRDETYAIHYWEVSWANPARIFDWIQGEKFLKIANYIYTPEKKVHDDWYRFANAFNPSEFEKGGTYFIYTSLPYLKNLLSILEYLKGQFIVITHNGDQRLEDEWINTMDGRGNILNKDTLQIPDNVLYIYSTNNNTDNPKIRSMPIGLCNNRWWKGEYLSKIVKMKALEEKIDQKKLVYMNFKIQTNINERPKVWDLFKDKSWVTAEIHKGILDSYFENLISHKFALAPEGNGFDTHRVWEALYLDCIPIVKKAKWNKQFRDFPICFVDDWEQVTERFLNDEYKRIKSINFDKNKLNFEYWKNKILTIS